MDVKGDLGVGTRVRVKPEVIDATKPWKTYTGTIREIEMGEEEMIYWVRLDSVATRGHSEFRGIGCLCDEITPILTSERRQEIRRQVIEELGGYIPADDY